MGEFGNRNVGRAILIAAALLCSLLVLNACEKEQNVLGPAAYIKDTLTLPYNVDIDEDLRVNGDVTIDGSASVGNLAILNLVGLNNLVVGNGITTTFLTLSGGAMLSTKGAVTVTDDINVRGDVTMNTGGRLVNASGGITVADSLYVTGDALFGAELEVTNHARINDFLILEDVEAAAIITTTGYITPTMSNQRIAAAAWVSPTVAGGCVPGTIVILYNWADKNIFLADSGTLILTDDFLMGQHDILTLMCNAGGNWAELSRSNN